MISKYNYFLENLTLGSVLNESIIYYHKDLKSLLKMMRHRIAYDLLAFEGKSDSGDFTFINVDDDGFLSFIQAKNANKIIRNALPFLDDDHTAFHLDVRYSDDLHNQISGHTKAGDIYRKSRNQIKIGKFINKIFPGKYGDVEIEEFVNRFKSMLNGTGFEFEIVEGEDIRTWYSSNNYAEKSGSLGSSCMSSPSKSNLFDLYVKNPEVCRMLILKDGDKIIGRSLIWKVSSPKISRGEPNHGEEIGMEYFLDRQYTITEKDVFKFTDYAEKQGWGYKTRNNYKEHKIVTFEKENLLVDMTVELKNFSFEYYPFLDTFRSLDPATGILYNDLLYERPDRRLGYYILSATSGGRYIVGNDV